MAKVVTYTHPLGAGQLQAFAIDPKITESELIRMVTSKDGTSKFSLANLSQDIFYKAKVQSVEDLHFQVLDEPYQVPEKLRAYREALESKMTAEGKFNGPIAVVEGDIGISMKLRRGGYFDFLATKLEVVPANLAPDKYPAKATIEQLMKEYGIPNESRARYLGFAFLMLPQDGKEFQLVQRAKGMGVAADCIASSGSTPPFSEDFFSSGFNFSEFYADHIAQEMQEEFKMSDEDFRLGQGFLIDDKKTMPHIGWMIKTPLSTEAMAERILGNPESIKEHPVLYSILPSSIPEFLKRFDMWPSVSFLTDLFYQNKESSNPAYFF